MTPSSRRYGLTPAEQKAYAEDGFFLRTAVFRPDEIEAMREASEKVVARAEDAGRIGRDYLIDGNRYVEAASETIQYEHNGAAETIRVIEPFHHLHPVFDRLIDDPRIVDPMCGVIGTEGVAVWTDKINLKRPRKGSGFRWHQDSPYWTHACDHVDLLPNVLISLDDADEENGCFRVVRGSHREGCLPGIQDDTTLGVLFTDPDHFDEANQVPAIVPAGSLVFFNPHAVHGSEPNVSERPRRAMVLTYQPAGNRMFKIDATRNAGA
ncbi:MAG: phytanoyl-CoA dioxygenase family protein [Myxococcota bacterium]|jgi:ectoine hydroxylase-related dioxygenase (phytanoyl-CoA dioxygenase family)